MTQMIGGWRYDCSFLIFCQLMGWLVLLARRSGTKDAELLGAVLGSP